MASPGTCVLLVLLVALAGRSQAAPYSHYPGVQLWFLTPMEVAEQISRIQLTDYREVPEDAPEAARNSPMDQQSLREEMVDVSQFHTQDGAGRAVFGYSTGDQVRIEARSGAGRVRGSYSYRDPTGKIVKVQYWDDGDGFHVSGNSLPSESDLPEPVTETPEVAAARQQHEALHAQALQAALLAGTGAGDEAEAVRVEQPSQHSGGDIPPVYGEDGTELRRYPAIQHASLYDPSHLHDAEREAVIINNPELEPSTFNDIQLFRSRGLSPDLDGARSARGPEPEQEQVQRSGFFYSFEHPAPVLVAGPGQTRPRTQPSPSPSSSSAPWPRPALVAPVPVRHAY